MQKLSIKKFTSEEFNDYSNPEELINKKIQAINLYMPIASNGAYGNYDVNILDARLPSNTESEKYKEIKAIKDFINQIDGINGDAKIYFLLSDNIPASFAVFTKSDGEADTYILEMIKTQEKYKSRGYITQLLKHAFQDLKESVQEIIAKINEENNESLGLISDLTKQSVALNEKINAVCKVSGKSDGKYQVRFFISDQAIELTRARLQENEM